MMDDPSGKWLKTLVTLLKQPHIEPTTLETAMRFCVRYTQDHSTACRFANMGGISGLLNLQSSSSFVGVEEMATMLIRHVFENQAILTFIMQSILCRGSAQNLPCRLLASSAGRNQSLFTEILKSSMEVVKDELDFVGKVTFLKLDDMCQESKDAIIKLLDALPALVKRRQSKKIFNAEKLLLLLAELSRLCPPVAQLILDHRYQPGHTGAVTHGCSAIEFIMANGKAFSDSQHQPDAITTLVLFMIRKQAKQVMPRLLTQLVAALKQALFGQQSTDNQARTEATITVIDTAICFACHCSSDDNWSVVVKAIEESKLLDSLAQRIYSLDFPTKQAAIGAKAILRTLKLFVGKMSQHQLNNFDASAAEEYDLAEQVKEVFSMARTDHSNENAWQFNSCCYNDDSSHISRYLHDHTRAVISTSRDLSDSTSRFQSVPCSICRWYQERYLVDGSTSPLGMKDSLAAAINELESYRYGLAQAISKQFAKWQNDAREEHQVRLPKGQEKTNQEERGNVVTAIAREPTPRETVQLTDRQRAILGDAPLPDGLDPAVLVELPDDIRREVIAQQIHLNFQTARRRHREMANRGPVTASRHRRISIRPLIPFRVNSSEQIRQPVLTRNLLDERSLASLLSLLLVRCDKLLANTNKELLEALCGHLPTRRWLTEALLSIIKRTKDSPMQPSDGINLAAGKLWFVDRTSSQASPGSRIRLHSGAGKVVCGNALGLLKCLAIQFPDLLVAPSPTTISSKDFFDVLAELEGVKVEAPISSSKANSN